MKPQLNTNRKTPSIPIKTLFYIAWRNLISKKLRSFLTVIGVTIGIGAIFFLLSFGLGLRDLVAKQVIGDKSIKAIDISSPNSKILRLDTATVNRFRELPHVDKVGNSFSFPGSITYNGGEVDTVTYGVDVNYQELTSIKAPYGRLLKNEDSDSVLFNMSGLKAIGLDKDPKAAIGKKVNIVIPLRNAETEATQIKKEFTIVGVVDTGSGTEIYVPNGIFEGVGVKVYSQVKLVADDTSNVSGLRKQIEGLGYQTLSPIDTLDQINQVFKFFTIILISFGAVGMVVSVLGMFNTLTISLLERTREIGLMIALGGRDKDMRRLFVFEAILLSIFGAVMGILLAVIGGEIVNLVMNSLSRRRGVTQGFDLFATPWWSILGIIAFMICVGFLVVQFPARRAQKINPIDALRRE